ncbi:MAG: substrate-binding domain-containing protein [Candidatus Eisenbacteria bacterium]|nr:substrate-binding domain-containing protein [Candidatus Eisenbacteria bacterium]
MEDSQTSGRITVVSAQEAYGLIARERDAFQALYPQASITVRPGSSREAVRSLFAAECDLAVITRELTQEEREAAVRGRLALEGYRFARDALLAVVHESNPVENMSVPQLRAVYAGEAGAWPALAGGSGPIHPVLQPVASDVTEFFVEQVMGGEPIRARVYTEDSDSGVVARVKRDPAAIGYVTLAAAERGAKVLSLASLTGLPYRKPDLEAVYRGEYPMTRFFNLYERTSGPRLAAGFITFVTSRDGQELVRERGLVPTTVPVRFVRRSPMLGSH